MDFGIEYTDRLERRFQVFLDYNDIRLLEQGQKIEQRLDINETLPDDFSLSNLVSVAANPLRGKPRELHLFRVIPPVNDLELFVRDLSIPDVCAGKIISVTEPWPNWNDSSRTFMRDHLLKEIVIIPP